MGMFQVDADRSADSRFTARTTMPEFVHAYFFERFGDFRVSEVIGTHMHTPSHAHERMHVACGYKHHSAPRIPHARTRACRAHMRANVCSWIAATWDAGMEGWVGQQLLNGYRLGSIG